VVGSKAKKSAVHAVVEERKISKTRACRVLGLNRSTLTYKPKPKQDEPLIARMKELAEQHKRWGVVSIHGVCRREGLVVNHKRSLRVYREQQLQIRHRPGRKRFSVVRAPIAKPSAPNQVWSMDFIHDRLENGRKVKVLNVVDDFSRVCVGQIVSDSITGKHLVEFFESLDRMPLVVRCDNGPEFWSKAFQAWAHGRIKIDFIQPGKPQQNAIVESFNGKFREQCLNENIFFSIEHAREVVEEWREIYNDFRPHRSLKGKTPKEFEREHQNQYQHMELLSS
jgi:putative transposase